MYVLRVATALIWAIFEIQISCTNLDTHKYKRIWAMAYLFLVFSLQKFSSFAFLLCIFRYKIYEWTTLQFRCCSSCALVSNCAKQLQKRKCCIRKIDGNPKLLLHLVSSLQTIKFKQNFRSSKMHFIILIFRIFGQRNSQKMCHQTTIVLKCCISIAAKSNLAMKVQLCIYFWLAR